MRINPLIEESWKNVLIPAFNMSSFGLLKAFLQTELLLGKTIYPNGKNIFEAFNLTPFNQVKVVIIGQDPYHGMYQAHGLCFSVPIGVQPPPSLVNIFKELKSDVGMRMPNHGNLSYWAQQGVFLLNSILTVEAGMAASHRNKGWEAFTNFSIQKLSEEKTDLVFLLWGKYAQDKIHLIDESKHYILKAAHPSPLSAHNGFWGCKHFSKTNELLIAKGIIPIDWQI